MQVISAEFLHLISLFGDRLVLIGILKITVEHSLIASPNCSEDLTTPCFRSFLLGLEAELTEQNHQMSTRTSTRVREPETEVQCQRVTLSNCGGSDSAASGTALKGAVQVSVTAIWI